MTLLCLAPAAGWTASWYVGGSGRDSNPGTLAAPFRTLQKAAGLTQPGDTVFVLNGTYKPGCAGCDVLDISISGAATAPITYRAYPGAYPVINFANGWSGIQVDAAYIVIDGFDIVGGRTKITLAYALSQENNLNNYLTSANGVVIADFINGTQPHHVTVRNCLVHDAPGGGIAAIHADYITLAHNTTWLNAFWSPYANSGISLYESRDIDGKTGVKNVITGNLSYENREYIPFYVTGTITDGNGIIVDDNLNTQSNHIPYGGRTSVTNNVVHHNGGSGIHAYASAHVDVVNNTAVLNNQTPALNEGQIFGNTASDMNVLNNILVAAAGRTLYSAYNDAPNVLYNYNLLTTPTPKSGLRGAPAGPNDLLAPAGFVDRKADNFHLVAGSAAVGSGTAQLEPPVDFDRYPRPVGDDDRGAYQFRTTP